MAHSKKPTQPTVLDGATVDPLAVTLRNEDGTAAGGASDGAIVDGGGSIKATVKNFSNSNPLCVHSVDTNGDYSPPGAGTQYTEDAAATANPVGNALIMVRDDALSGQVSADGDNIAARGTNNGELYVKHVDDVAITAAALPLPSGAATSAKQDDIITALGTPTQEGGDINVTDRALRDNGKVDIAAIDVALPSGTNILGKVGIDQTTPGTTDSVSVATGQGAGATIGTTSGAAVVTDANGTLQQYLRGIVKLLITTGTIVLGAGTALIGKIIAGLSTDVLYNGTTALTPKFAAINLSATGEVVAAVTSKKIRVLSLAVMSAGTTTVRLTSDTAGTPAALSGLFPLIANTGFVLPFNPVGWCESGSGVNLGLTLGSSVDVDGMLTYVEV